MKVRTNLSVLVIAAALLAPAAYGAETAPETTTSEQNAGDATQDQLQIPEKDEAFDVGLPPATQSDITGVREEIQLLRDQWQKGIDRTVVSTKRLLTISGTGQLKYAKPNPFLKDNPAGVEGFSTPSFGLSFTGNLYKDYVAGKDLNYSLGFLTTDKNAISISNANLTYNIFNTLDKEGSYLSITGGQQKKFFGIEATASEEFKPTVAGAQFASKLGLDARDIGFVLAGDLFPTNDFGYSYRVPTVQYYLGLVNGTGANAAETNNSKDVFARLQFNAPVDYSHILRGLSFGVSGLKGRQDYTATNTTTNTATFTSTPAAPAVATKYSLTTSTKTDTIISKGDKERWGVDLAYVNTPIGFTLEYVHGKDLVPTNGTVAIKDGVAGKKVPYGFKDTQSEGYTFTLFYSFGDQFVNSIKTQERWDDYYPLTYQPFVRFDRWVPDTDTRSVRTDIWTVGFNYFFAATTKLQANYNITRDYKKDGGVYDNDAFLAQFQFGF
ncbi:MAG: porin [Desulfuromonadaceae bacterium]